MFFGGGQAAELERTKTELAAANQQVAAFHEQIALLEEAAAASAERTERLQNELAAARGACAGCSSAPEAAAAGAPPPLRTELREQCERAAALATEAEGRTTLALRSRFACNAFLLAAIARAQAAESAADGTRQQARAAYQREAESKKAGAAEQAALRRQLSEQREEAERKLAERNAEVGRLRSLIAAGEEHERRQGQALQAAQAEAWSLRQDLREARRLTAAQGGGGAEEELETVEILQDELEALRVELQDERDHSADLDRELHSQATRHSARVDELRRELSEARRGLGEERAQRERAEAELAAERTAQRAELLQERDRALAEAAQERDRGQEEAARLQQQLADANRRAEECAEKFTAAVAAAEEAEAERDAAYARATADCGARLAEAAAAAREERDAQERQREAQVTELRAARDKLGRQLVEWRQRGEAAQRDLVSTQKRESEWRQEAERLRDGLDAESGRNDDAAAEIALLKQRCAEAAAQLLECRGELDAAVAEGEGLKRMCRDYRQDLQNARAHSERLQHELREQTKEYRHLDERLSRECRDSHEQRTRKIQNGSESQYHVTSLEDAIRGAADIEKRLHVCITQLVNAYPPGGEGGEVAAEALRTVDELCLQTHPLRQRGSHGEALRGRVRTASVRLMRAADLLARLSKQILHKRGHHGAAAAPASPAAPGGSTRRGPPRASAAHRPPLHGHYQWADRDAPADYSGYLDEEDEEGDSDEADGPAELNHACSSPYYEDPESDDEDAASAGHLWRGRGA
eukprot:TRINITY_DN3549_c1_g1_i4.p1 TRINITY_DN3549_c1_g1~~TRINITY_DN3549_c1_g1_i4.p1  ORF type:complete len:791 (+),score=280.94 TRINITY_DN3549_c1_g1_i4:88-2373(+)